jgi:hypothetical protein
MGIEQSRGAERPIGNSGSTPAEGTNMQILSTEHWSLLATRSLGYSDFFGRTNMFFSVLSGTVIALALIAQAGRFDQTFFIAAILLLAIVVFVGLTTIARVAQLSHEDGLWVIGMNRIRHAYLELHPELSPYFVTSPYDDMRGIVTTLGLVKVLPGQHGSPSSAFDKGYFYPGLTDLRHAIMTLPGMLMIIVAVVGGAWGTIVSVAFGAPQVVAIAVGAACFLVIAFGVTKFGQQSVRSNARGLAPRFPTPD